MVAGGNGSIKLLRGFPKILDLPGVNKHPCEVKYGLIPALKRVNVECVPGDKYISKYTNMFTCANIGMKKKTPKKISLKCEMKYKAVVNMTDSYFNGDSPSEGSPCGEPAVFFNRYYNMFSMECPKGREFSTPSLRNIFKCETLTAPYRLASGKQIDVNYGCEARFRYDCRNDHPSCKVT